MPQYHQKFPWNGGLNSSLDPGAISDNDLVIGDNIIFATSGARIKRQGFSYFDALSAIPTISKRSSSGTTRTLVFASSVSIASPLNQKLVVGEHIDIATSLTSGNEFTYYAGTFAIASITTTTVTNDTITYTGIGSLTEGSTSTSTLSATRTHATIGLHDYWRFVPSTALKAQLLIAITDTAGDTVPEVPKIYKYDSNGRRSEIITYADSANFPTEITKVSVATMNERFLAAFDGKGNRAVKYHPETTSEYQLLGSASVASTDTPVNTGTEIVTFLYNHPFSADQRVHYYTTGTAIGGLTNDTIYYIIRTSDTQIQLAATSGGAAINLTSQGVGIQTFNQEDMPKFSIMQTHIGRLWTNDKDNPDRIHYSATGNPEQWYGIADSGALDLIIGDGDSEGVTAIYPSFKNSIFVAKGDKLYEIYGNAPENFSFRPLTMGLGALSHNSVASVDVDDVTFISRKGIHSLLATDAHGDFKGAFLSNKIQPTFNLFPPQRLQYSSSVYVPTLNSVAFAVTDESASINDALYLYNVELKEWYRWPDSDAQIVAVYEKDKVKKLFFGTSDGRVVETQNGSYTDFSSTATQYKIKTGAIYPAGDPLSIKAFKKVMLYYKPKTNYEFNLTVKIDNYPSQVMSFSQDVQGDMLDVDFILGSSVLGRELILAPFTQPIDGYGRGISLQIEHNTADEQVEIYGYGLEYDLVGPSQETITELPND